MELVATAAAAGFDAVGLRLMDPPDANPRHAVDDPKLMRDTRQRLVDTGLQVLDVEAIWIDATIRVQEYERLFEAAASLDARHAVAMIHDTDVIRGAESFSALCALAAPYGISVNLEFAKYSAVKTISQAAGIIGDSGSTNAAVLIDTLHFARSGGEPSDLLGLRAALAPYIQIADARREPPPDVSMYRDEALGGRLDPGTGALPLLDVLRKLPTGLSTSVEAPNRTLDHLAPVARARLALDATRALFTLLAKDPK
ncbi:MAG: sugar phosphate isomerase/epimerase family protein [Chloroflexota bacterium]